MQNVVGIFQIAARQMIVGKLPVVGNPADDIVAGRNAELGRIEMLQRGIEVARTQKAACQLSPYGSGKLVVAARGILS